MRREYCLLFLLSFILSPGAVHAQTPVVPAPMPAKPEVTLATALAAVPPPTTGAFLTVSAEKVPLPPGIDTPAPSATARQVADGFGRTVQRFGTVQAIAPPTMVVLNTDPGTPNIYDGMPTSDALKLLAASLDDRQWQAPTGPQGLGLSDLSSDDQRSLFLAQFPSSVIKVYPVQSPLRDPHAAPPIPSRRPETDPKSSAHQERRRAVTRCLRAWSSQHSSGHGAKTTVRETTSGKDVCLTCKYWQVDETHVEAQTPKLSICVQPQLKDFALVVSGSSGCDKWQDYPNVSQDADAYAHRGEVN